MAAFREALGGEQALGGNLPMPIKDAFEMLIKIFHRKGTELVKDASDFYPIIGMGIAPIAGGHEKTIILFTRAAQIRNIVMAVTQHEANTCGNFPQQGWCWVIISHIGDSHYRCYREPDCSDNGDEVQLPAIDPAVPT